MKKHSIALLEGRPDQQSGEIRLPIRLDPDNRPYQIHDPLHGKMGIGPDDELLFNALFLADDIQGAVTKGPSPNTSVHD